MLKKIFILTFFTSILFAQSAGNTGLSFLKIGSSARTIATSDIGFLNGDVSSVFYNPASVNFQESAGVIFTHQAWIQDVTSEIVNANFSLFGLPFSIGANTTKIKNFEVRTIPTENPDATFNVNYFYGSLSSGFNLYENLYFGFTIKYLYESLFTDDAGGTGYDLGLVYNDLIDNLKLGFSLRNLGSMDNLRNEKTKLPMDFIANASYQLTFENSLITLNPLFGVQKYSETDNLHIHAGTEVIYDNQFSLRAGYVSGFEAKGLSVGAGFFFKGFNIDYALTPFSYGLGSASTISLQYTF